MPEQRLKDQLAFIKKYKKLKETNPSIAKNLIDEQDQLDDNSIAQQSQYAQQVPSIISNPLAKFMPLNDKNSGTGMFGGMTDLTVRNQPIEGSVVGDLANIPAGKQRLPDIQGELVSPKELNAPQRIKELSAPQGKMNGAGSNLAAGGLAAGLGYLGSRALAIDPLGENSEINTGKRRDEYVTRPQENTATDIADQVISQGLMSTVVAPKLPQQPEIQGTVNMDLESPASEEDNSVDTFNNPVGNIDASAEFAAAKGNLGRAPAIVPEQLPIIPQQDAPDDFDAQLRAARDQDAQQQLLFGILKASQMGGKALSMTPGQADTSYADQGLANKNQNVTNLKTEMDMKAEHRSIKEKSTKRDPNSEISKFYQGILLEMNPKMNVKGLSAEQLSTIVPQLDAIAARKQIAHDNLEAKKELARDKEEASKLSKQEKMEEKDAKHLIDYRKERDPMLASSRSPLGKEVSRYTQSEHALGLIHGMTDLNQLTDIHKKELAVALATMISPGLPHHETIASLSPNSLNGEIAKQLTFLTGKPAPTNTAGIAQLLKNSVENQRKISQNYISKFQAGVDSAYASKIAKNPDAYKRVSDNVGFDVKEESKKETNKATVKLPTARQSGKIIQSGGKTYKVNPDGLTATEM